MDVNYFISNSNFTFNVILKILGIVIDYGYNFLVWLYLNYKHVINAIVSFSFMFFALLFLIFFSVFSAYSFLEQWKDKLISVDLVNGMFIHDFLTLIISIAIMFVASLIFHMIYIKFKFDEWSYQLTNIILTFLVAVCFVALLGMSVTLSEYVNLFVKNSNFEYKVATGYGAEVDEFTIKSIVNILVYGSFALVTAFQTSFNIAYRSELNRKKQLKSNED